MAIGKIQQFLDGSMYKHIMIVADNHLHEEVQNLFNTKREC